jgi:RHS repeat-associated protein
VLDGAGSIRLYRTSEIAGVYSPPPGIFRELSIAADGKIKLRYKNGTIQIYHPTDGGALSGRLLSIIDKNGNARTLQYDTDGLLSRVIDSFGRETVYAYTDGLLASITDFSGRTATLTHDGSGNLVQITLPPVIYSTNGVYFPAGVTYAFSYDAASKLMVSVQSPNEYAAGGQARINNIYDNTGRILEQHIGGTNLSGRPAGGSILFDYATVSTDTLTTVYDRNSNRLEYQFNPDNLLTAKRDNYRGSGPSSIYSETTYAYDAELNPIFVVHPLGNIEQSTYDAQSDDVLARGNQLRQDQIADATRGATHAVLVTEFTYEPVYQQIARVRSEKFFAASVANSQCPAIDSSIFVTNYLFDYQEDSGVTHLADLAARRGVASAVLEQRLIDRGIVLGLGDLNYDGALDQLSGNTVIRETPAVSLLSHLEQVKVEGDATQRFVHKFRFDSNGSLLEMEDPLGVVTSYNYDLFGRWTQKVVDSIATSRRSITYPPVAITFRREYNAAGCLAEITDGRGVKRQLNYNALNRLESTVRDVAHVASANAGYGLTLPRSYSTLYLHDANGNVVETRVENRNGWQLPAFPVGSYVSTSTTFDILDQPIESTSRPHVGATPLTTRKYYDPNGNVIEIQNPAYFSNACSSKEFEYTPRNKISIQFSARGTIEEGAIQFAYDENGNLVELRLLDANGLTMRATQYIHDGHDRTVKTILPNGTEASNAFDAHGLVVRTETRGNNAQQQYVLLVKEAFCFDAQDRNTRHDRYLFVPDLTVGAVQLTEGPLTPDSGYLTEIIEYDASSNLTFHHQDNGAVDSYKYDGMGRCPETVDSLGNVVLQEYDGMGNTFKRTVVEKSALHDVDNTFSDYQLFDAENRRTRFTDGENNTVYYDYDSRGNQVTVRYQDGKKTDDPFGLVEGEINEPGSEIRYYYDGLGRLRRVENYAADDVSVGIVTDFAFDANGNRTTIIDDNLNETLFEYDCRDRLVEKTNSDGTYSNLFYNAAGERVGFLDENGSQFTYTLDVNGSVKRLSVVGSMVGTTTQTFSYNGRGAIIKATDDNGVDSPEGDVTTEFRFDSTGRMIEATRNGRTISVDYHSDFAAPSRVSLPSGASVKLTLDTLRRPTTLTYVGGAEEQTEIARRYYYGPRRKLEKVVLGNNVEIQFSRIDGAVVDYGFDNNGRNTFKQYVSVAKNKRLLKIERRYDRRQDIVLEKIRSIRRTGAKPYGKVKRKIVYAYDSVRRLSSYRETRSAGSGDNSLDEVQYNMDGVGNRTSVVANSQATAYTADEMNQYQFVGGSEHSYDDNGNMVQRGQGLDLQWDALNRLVVAQRPDGTVVRFAYDAFGNRVSRTVVFGNGAQSHWSYLHYDRKLYEIREMDTASGVVLNHVEILNQLELDTAPAIVRNGEIFYLMKGKNQNVLGLMNSAGDVVESYRYDPFGGLEAYDEEGNAIAEPVLNAELLFQSRPYDALLGLYNFRRRWYQADTGRFASRDPVGVDKHLNQYTFGLSNPNRYMDPRGEMAHPAIMHNNCSQSERSDILEQDELADHYVRAMYWYYKQSRDGYSRGQRDRARFYFGAPHPNTSVAYRREMNRRHWSYIRTKVRRLVWRFQSGRRYYRCGSHCCKSKSRAVQGCHGVYTALCDRWLNKIGYNSVVPPHIDYNYCFTRWSTMIHEQIHRFGVPSTWERGGLDCESKLHNNRDQYYWKRRRCPVLYQADATNRWNTEDGGRFAD